MHLMGTHRGTTTPSPAATADTPPLWRWLERIALLIGLAVVIARATMTETLYEPHPPMPGQAAPPIGAGPTSSIVLSLLACLPGLVALARRALDRDYRLTHGVTYFFMLALAAWAILSPLWASDVFAALVDSVTLLGAMALIWGMAQLVRTWSRLRLLAGVGLGLLLVFCGQGILYQKVDLPELQQQWREDIGGFRTEALRQRGLVEGELAAERFGQKIMAGEMIGWTRSANSFAAIVVTLCVVAAGAAIQRIRDRQPLGVIIPAIGITIGAWMLPYADSKTAYATPLLAAGLLLIIAIGRNTIVRHRKLLFSLCVVALLLGILAAVAHGLYHDTLFHRSLTFRWRYWVASARMFVDHPLLGVGFGNFGLYYLSYRLPVAVEEIQDPHNLFVRFFTELGLIGGGLAVAWEVSRWWRLTRPARPGEDPAPTGSAIMPALAVVIAGAVVNVIASIDFIQPSGYLIWELVFKRPMMALLLLAGILAVLMRSPDHPNRDPRPAPWLLYGVIIATAVFMVHSMLDFVFAEGGPLYVFAMLTGGALGLRSVMPDELAVRLPRPFWVAKAIAAWLVWLLAMILLAWPVLLAEETVRQGDALLRAGRAPLALGRYENAIDILPMNPSYPQRAYAAALYAGGEPVVLERWLQRAIDASPRRTRVYLDRARYRLSLSPPRMDAALEDLATAVSLDPQEMSIRLEYADALERAGRNDEAARQIEHALRINDAYDPDEIERLSPSRVEELQARLASLRS